MTADVRALMRAYYDDLGAAEWDRLTRDVAGRVSHEVHRRFLAEFIPQDARVLEVGAGPGRFTHDLAAHGCSVVVTDISEVQLDLHRRYTADTSTEAAVERRMPLDVCDTSDLADQEFDAVLAFGGPLSYAFGEVENAVKGLLRVVPPGGHVVASVMSSLGTWRHHLTGVTQLAQEIGEDLNDLVLSTGDLRHVPDARHVCRMFRASEIPALAEACDADLVGVSASNWASLSDPAVLESIESEDVRWHHFLNNEVLACRELGALDGGTHLLFAFKRRETDDIIALA